MCLHKWCFPFRNILYNWVPHQLKVNKKLAFLNLFSKYLIARGEYGKRKKRKRMLDMWVLDIKSNISLFNLYTVLLARF